MSKFQACDPLALHSNGNLKFEYKQVRISARLAIRDFLDTQNVQISACSYVYHMLLNGLQHNFLVFILTLLHLASPNK